MNPSHTHASASDKLAAILSLLVAGALITVLFASCGGQDLTFPGTGVFTPTVVGTDTPVPTDTPG
jgi:hypothetical protein